MTVKKILAAAAASVAVVVLAGCATDADVASRNLKTAAEQFEVNRRITVVNGVTDKYLMLVEGRCSLEFPDNRTEVLCKLADGSMVKHHVIRGDNILVMSEQTNGTTVSTDQYRVIFKPDLIVPNVERQ